jgi:hypothetical protein
MWQQLLVRLLQAWRWLWPRLVEVARLIVALVRGPIRRVVVTMLEVCAALLVAFYEWGWRPLADLLARLHRFPIVARIEDWVVSLPPYGALALFATPAVVLFPFKLLALYLLATGHPIVAVLLIAAAKIVGTAFVARVFMLTQPKLMQIAWFKRAYDWFMPWKEHLFALVKTSRPWRLARVIVHKVRRSIAAVWASPTAKAIRARIKLAVVAPVRRIGLRFWRAISGQSAA